MVQNVCSFTTKWLLIYNFFFTGCYKSADFTMFYQIVVDFIVSGQFIISAVWEHQKVCFLLSMNEVNILISCFPKKKF
jgi:hypothetical protein